MQIIWHGTASVELVCSSGRIIFDPFVPLKGSETHVDLADYDGFDSIFITHGHFDHIASLPAIVKRSPGVMIYCSAAPYRTLLKKGVPEGNLSLIAFDQTLTVNGFTLRVFHGRHAVLPKATPRRALKILTSPQLGNIPWIVREAITSKEMDETLFYLVEAEGKTLALMGSMNLRPEVDYPTGADLLILPYNGWEDNFPPAVGIVERLKPRAVLLDHYDNSFPPLTTPLDLSPILIRYPGLARPMQLGKVETI